MNKRFHGKAGPRALRAGPDAWQLLAWVRGPQREAWAQGVQVQLLARVFGEQCGLVEGRPVALPQEKRAMEASGPGSGSKAAEGGLEQAPVPVPTRVSEVAAPSNTWVVCQRRFVPHRLRIVRPRRSQARVPTHLPLGPPQ